MNCPRYVHRYEKKVSSRYVPRVEAETPLCEWKRIDAVQDTLRPDEIAARARRSDKSRPDEWMGRVFTGDEKA